MEYEFARQRIIRAFDSKPARTKLSLDELVEVLPEMSDKDVLAVASKMVNEGTLGFWSGGSRTLYTLNTTED